MKKLGTEPAFPDSLLEFNEENNAVVKEHHYGMSTRLLIASNILGHLYSGYYAVPTNEFKIEISGERMPPTIENFVKKARMITDELLKQEDEQ